MLADPAEDVPFGSRKDAMCLGRKLVKLVV